MNNNTNAWFFLGAAFVGLVSAAGVYLIEQIRQDKRRHTFTQDLARLDGQLSTLRQELETIRQLQKEKFNNSGQSKPSRRRLRNSTALSVTSNEEYNSALDLDSSDLEFYDLSSDEDTTTNSKAIEKDFEEVDKLLANESLYNEVLEKLENLIQKYPKNPDLLWRFGKALKIKANHTDNIEERNKLVNKGIQLCELAVEIRSNCAQSHKWLALLLGIRSEFMPTKEKIIDGQRFKVHLEKALEIAPNDPVLHHMLGRFAFETAKITWLEKTIASQLFAEVPSSTYQEALEKFLKAENLSENDWKENRLFIAKCEIAIGKTESAVEWLTKAELARNEEQEKVHEEVKNLLEKYNKRQ